VIKAGNLWADRFAGLTRETIFKRTLRFGEVVQGLENVGVEVAVRRLENALKPVYYPSDQCLDALQALLACQREHCLRTYTGVPELLRTMAACGANEMLADVGSMTLLTGHAGVGKSSLFEALIRLQPPDDELNTGAYSGVFPLVSMRFCKVHANGSAKDILTTLSGIEGAPRVLVAECRLQALRSGWSAVVVDEMQFATQGPSNARVTQMLMSLSYIGVPVFYAANFSLLNKLAKRPQEDQHRLISDPILLSPETVDSRAWSETLTMMQAVAPDYFVFSVKKDAEIIHRLTFGVNRNLVKLLLVAFQVARARNCLVGVSELEAAYNHQKYSSYKRDVEALTRQAVTGTPVHGRSDLWSEIPLPKSSQVHVTEQLKKARASALALKKLEASMTREELEAHRDFQRRKKQPTSRAAVIPIKKQRSASVDDLIDDTRQAYRDLTD
jgi:energy-coupling factor transporter ATP-binding protein EcfA2